MRYGALAVALAGIVAVFSWPVRPFAAQAPTAARSSGSGTTRTAWGDPDLQGKWQTVETATPMERPKEFANREVLTDQEAEALIKSYKLRCSTVHEGALHGNEVFGGVFTMPSFLTPDPASQFTWGTLRQLEQAARALIVQLLEEAP